MGKTLLVWGGSTSVGSNAIQLALAAGYEVITTASPRNFDYVKKLGASQGFDYNSKTVIADVIKAFEGKTIAGALAVGSSSAEACLDIVRACHGDKFVSMASFPISLERLPKGRGLRAPPDDRSAFVVLRFDVVQIPNEAHPYEVHLRQYSYG